MMDVNGGDSGEECLLLNLVLTFPEPPHASLTALFLPRVLLYHLMDPGAN